MSPPADRVTESLERVLQSALFKKADRQSRFLRHVVRKHLDGDDGSLREISIGLEVYERPGTYDPKADPIVRVEASRLRSRLREYYETAGADDEVRIDIPKGSYVPTFQWRVAPSEPEVPSASRQTPKPWLIGAALGTLVLIGVIVAVWPRPPARAKLIDSIAVLPFADLSPKKDISYLTEGLTEQIQEELSRIRDLRVEGSTSAKQVSVNPDLRAAARQIGVDALLQGSVRADDKKVRVTVRLLDGKTGSGIWSGSFDGERTGLFDLEEQIAQAIAGKLAIQLAVRQEGVDARKSPQRAQAYEYYQRGRALAEHASASPLNEVYRLYQLASTTDPSCAAAHAGIAQALIMSGGGLGGRNYKVSALREAKRALELDPGLPLAYSVLILYYRDAEMAWAKARQVCAEARQKLPNAALVLISCASVEAAFDHAAALELTRRAVALDPLSAPTRGGLMFMLYQSNWTRHSERRTPRSGWGLRATSSIGIAL